MVRRTRIGYRAVGGGLRIPIHANVEGPCAGCDGSGCAPHQRLSRLVATAALRLEAIPADESLRREASLFGRRVLDGLLAAGGAALAHRTEQSLQEALARASEERVPLLLVLPAARLTMKAARESERAAPGRAPGAACTAELHGVAVRVIGAPPVLPRSGGTVALLGVLEPDRELVVEAAEASSGAAPEESVPGDADDGERSGRAGAGADRSAQSAQGPPRASGPPRFRILASAFRSEPPKSPPRDKPAAKE
jgi:hypothetical protein